MSDLKRFVPDGAHCVVESRPGRGTTWYCVVAIVPFGASVVINGYADEWVAEKVAAELNS